MNVNELRTNLRHFSHFLSDALKTPLWEAHHRLLRLRVCQRISWVSQLLGKKTTEKWKSFLKNEDSKRIKEWFKVHERKVQQSMQWDSVICAKKWLHSIGVACRISMLGCGCLKEFKILLASGSHPPRVGEVAARTEKAAPFVFQHFLLHILWTDTH